MEALRGAILPTRIAESHAHWPPRPSLLKPSHFRSARARKYQNLKVLKRRCGPGLRALDPEASAPGDSAGEAEVPDTDLSSVEDEGSSCLIESDPYILSRGLRVQATYLAFKHLKEIDLGCCLCEYEVEDVRRREIFRKISMALESVLLRWLMRFLAFFVFSAFELFIGHGLQSDLSQNGSHVTKPVEKPYMETQRPSENATSGGSRAGLFRTPISGGVQSATSAHGLPRPALAVRNLMEQARFAHLCTIMSRMHHRREGYPFGSLVDFATDSRGHPIFSFSPLAIHTRNLLADPRCTLVVQIPGWSGLSNARVTIFGDVVPLPADQQVSIKLVGRIGIEGANRKIPDSP
ncbi:hypothetical protein Taro_036871 [Colocasia esculenta]|uniref:CREG-like beta-barrel domain-containing protein n=1 Tax=Colocasia esculenta TaxID=4460 RepID=A0A843W2P0_COLES|nr:hypothetical protein [Colocasia esculenta]